MKKKILSFVLAICLIIPCAIILTACGGNTKPFDVKGKTLTVNGKASIVWEEETTDEQKTEYIASLSIPGVTTEAQLKEYFNKYAKDSKGQKMSFKNDGTVAIKGEDLDETAYYVQSEDLKTITVYDDEDHTAEMMVFSYIENGAYGYDVMGGSSICHIYMLVK